MTASARPGLWDIWRASAARLVAAGIEPDEARLEAEVLLRHVLDIDRAAFLAGGERPLAGDAAARFESLLLRRAAREPLAYITGRREFYGLDFAVDPRVLIPRPETEGLVERALAVARQRGRRPDLTLADVGSGSGCIAVALAAHLVEARVFALDAAAGALDVAAANARRHEVAERITFLRGDLLQPLPEEVDIIVSNPPYVATGDIEALAPEVARHEPRTALDGGVDGLDAVRRLLRQAPEHLRDGGAVLLEIGDEQGSEAALLAWEAFPHAEVAVERDLAGRERYLCVLT